MTKKQKTLTKTDKNRIMVLNAVDTLQKAGNICIDATMIKKVLGFEKGAMPSTLKGTLYRLVELKMVDMDKINPRTVYYKINDHGLTELNRLLEKAGPGLQKDSLKPNKPKRHYKKKKPQLVVPPNNNLPVRDKTELSAVESLAALIDENRKLKTENKRLTEIIESVKNALTK